MCTCKENNPCGQQPCSPPVNCDCPVKDLKSDCIVVTNDLPCAEIEAGQTLTETLEQMDTHVCEVKSELEQTIAYTTIIKNVGDGKRVFKGVDGLGRRELRTIKEDDSLITVVENADTVNIGLNETNLTTFIQTNQKTYDINNVGTGAKMYQEPDPSPVGNITTFNVKSIKSDNLIVTETATEVKLNSPISGIASAGTGTPIYNGVNIGTGNVEISSIKSDNLIITKELDGTININEPDFNGIKTFYVNSGYTPTQQFPAIGTLSRPYPTFEEARTAFIGNTNDITNPQWAGAKIIIQTNSIATNNPSVNFINIEFENNSTLTYTGTDDYMFDTEVLYTLIPKNSPRNDLTKDIRITLLGKGTITRNNGIGLIRGIGANRNGLGQLGDKDSIINIAGDITLAERIDYPSSIWDGDITNQGGVTLEAIYGYPHKYSLQLQPTVPLLYCEGVGANVFSQGIISNSNLEIVSLANVAIKVKDSRFTCKSLNIKTYGTHIATVSSTKMVDFQGTYQPRDGKNAVELDNAQIYCTDYLSNVDIGGYGTTGFNSFIKTIGICAFEAGVVNGNSSNYFNKFLDFSLSPTMNSFTLANSAKGGSIEISAIRYFIDSPQATFTITVPNTFIATPLFKSVSPVSITPNTLGTWASIFGTPCISGVQNFSNDGNALAGGVVTNSLYYNTTNQGLDLV